MPADPAMRKLPAIFHRFLVLAACLTLAACFDIREEVWIERNGAGRAELRYTVPESALLLGGGAAGTEQKIRELIASQPSLILDGVAVEVKDERATVSVNVSTKSMLSLLDLKKSATSVVREFNTMLFTALKAAVLADGDISDTEAAWLRKFLYADGKIDEEEKRFLVELKQGAKATSPAFDQLYKEAVGTVA